MSKQDMRPAAKPGQNGNKQATSNAAKKTQASAKPVSSTLKQPPTGKPRTKQAMQQQRRQEKEQQRLAMQRRAAMQKRITIGVVALLVIAAVGLTVAFLVYPRLQGPSASSNSSTSANTSPGGNVVDPNYPPIDGISCDASEQLVYHIHAHLTVYIDGQPVALPQSIGVDGSTCIYWLHTHTTDGVIHIESPTQKVYTLQNFVDIWQKFSSSQITFPTQLASSDGWTVYVNGKQVSGTFSKVNLNAHDVVTMAYNSPGIKPDTTYPWPSGE